MPAVRITSADYRTLAESAISWAVSGTSANGAARAVCLGGTMRSPSTGVVFALDLTHDVRMAETGLTRFPVIERKGSRKLVGMIALFDLLEARVRTLEAEHRRERALPVRFSLPRGLGRDRERSQPT